MFSLSHQNSRTSTHSVMADCDFARVFFSLGFPKKPQEGCECLRTPSREGINVFLWEKLINVCLPTPLRPHPTPHFKFNSFCVVLTVGFSNFLHSRIFQFKIKQFSVLNCASIKSPKRIFLHRILFLSMLSLRFWKRNKKVSKFFDCERN